MTIALPHRGWLFDLDGTVYLGEALIPGADEVIAALRADGRPVAFLSNKPLSTRRDYADKLTRLGIPAAAEQVVNSSLVLARHLQELDPGAPVFVIGEPPLIGELRDHGFEVRSDAEVRWVVIAFDRTFDYAKLNTALQAVKQGARRAAHRHQPGPHLSGRGWGDSRLRGHDGRRGGRDQQERRGRRGQAIAHHLARRAGGARRHGRRLRHRR